MNTEKTSEDRLAQSLRVLMVEDSERDAEGVVRELSNRFSDFHWKRVETEPDMKAALDAESWDAVISDFRMPNFGGMEALRVFKEKGLDIPFILVSGTIDEVPAIAALKAGANDYIMTDHLARLALAMERELYDAEARRERKDAEEALRTLTTQLERAKKDWERTYDAVPDMIAIIDLDYRIVRVNRAMAERFGLHPRDLVGKLCYECVHCTSEPPADCPHRQLLATGQPQAVELHEPSLGGFVDIQDTPLLDKEGRLIGSVLVVRDITERKQVQEALRQSEAQYRAIVDATTDYIYTVLIEDGRAVETIHGAGCDAVTGYSQTDFQTDSRLWYNMIHGEDRDKVEKQTAMLLAGHQPPSFEYRLIHKEGASRWVENKPVLRFDEQSRLIAYDALVTDITKRKQVEEEREELQIQLVQAQKMETIGRLAGGVAHDINNQLQVIFGFAEMAKALVESNDPIYAHIQEVKKAASQSADITQQLLAFARRQAIEPKVLDLSASLEGLLKMLRRLIGEDTRLSWNSASDLWPVLMDPSQLDQILANLCVNARDAISGVGQIVIETENITLDETDCSILSEAVPGDFVLLAVSDDGCGMDNETIKNIFEPFFTTKGADKGTGLGLATVYGIVKQNNGFVNVYSEPGHGTTFKIYLPRHAGEVEQIQTESVAEAPSGHGETVLVVEDAVVILDMIKMMLEDWGYIVLTAATPGEAMQTAKTHAGEIDLLITDVIMPEMNGADLSTQLVALYPNLKRLFMSGYTADVIALRGVLDQGVYFIQKPFNGNTLAEKIREVLLIGGSRFQRERGRFDPPTEQKPSFVNLM